MTCTAERLGGHPVTDALAVVDDTLAGVSDTPLWSLSDAEVADLVDAAARAERRLAELRLRLVAEAHGRDLAGKAAATSTQVWLRGVCNLSPSQAKGQVVLAAALDRLEPTRRALADGRISPNHVRVIADAVADLPDPAIAERAEADLIEASEVFDPPAVARLGRRISTLVDPEDADAAEARKLAVLERRAWRRRQLRFTDDGHGTVHLRGRLDTESAAVVARALDPLAAPRPAQGGPDRRTPAAWVADALVEVCRRALSTGGLPAQGGERPQVVVTIDHAKLAELTGPGTLDTGQQLSPGAVRRLACDAHIVPAVLGSESQPLDLGRAVRLFTPAQRRALTLRDRGCAFPACDRPPAWTEAHHVTHWIDGGPSDLNNAVLLCGYHHRTIHNGHWQVRITADGLPEFVPPTYVDPQQVPLRNPMHHLKRKRKPPG